MYNNGNKRPETTTPVLFGKFTRTIRKPENKNPCKDKLNSRAAKSCKLTCNKSIGGKTSPNTEILPGLTHENQRNRADFWISIGLKNFDWISSNNFEPWKNLKIITDMVRKKVC